MSIAGVLMQGLGGQCLIPAGHGDFLFLQSLLATENSRDIGGLNDGSFLIADGFRGLLPC